MTTYPIIKISKKEGLNWVVEEDCFLPECNIFIKKGFITDLVSSSRFFWFIIPPHGMSSNAAIIHDYCWRKSIFDRNTCDYIFLKLLKKSNLPKWQPYIMFLIVRTFGWLKQNKINK